MRARPIHAGLSVIAVAAVFASGCGHRTRASVSPPIARTTKPARIGTTETGIASWYGVPYDGRRTASGEIYDMRQLTAAHRTLPFNTWLQVTNLTNGKRVEVKVNDRGPFVRGRVIDLSLGAASEIDMVRQGTAKVRLKVIAPRKGGG
jgi:rare lipoprotein A